MGLQTLLFDTRRPSPETYIPEQIDNHRQQGLERDLKELERVKFLISIVKPTPDFKKMHRRLTELGKHGYQVMPHSKMNSKEITDYYRAVRSELGTQLFDAEYNISLYKCPEDIIF